MITVLNIDQRLARTSLEVALLRLYPGETSERTPTDTDKYSNPDQTFEEEEHKSGHANAFEPQF
ncbi:MAG: hypothetical protein J5I94_20495 [Phaeodactylibacter sp.]|nr:hypothetical protein [Phaeodactylibacter sp.]